MRQVFSVIAVSGIILCGAIVPAQAGLLEFFFPSLREVPHDPTKTMVAPFAEGEEGVVEKGKLSELPVNAVPLDKPHRVGGEIAEWVMVAAGDSMNFESGDSAAQIQARKALFDAAGLQQYQTFLRDKNIMKVIDSGRYNVRSYVENTPLLMNEGVVNKRYRWLYQVPVVLSYMDKSMKNYKNQDPITQKAVLNIQIGRVAASAEKPDGLQVEQWSGEVSAFDKQ